MKQRKLRKRHRDVIDTIKPEVRERKARELDQMVRAEDVELAEQEKIADQHIVQTKDHPGNGHGAPALIRWLTISGFVLMAADVALQRVVNAGAFALSSGLLWLMSVGIAIGFSELTKGVAIALLHDDEMPARSIRITRACAVGSFVITMLFFCVVLLGRTVTPEWAGRLMEEIAVSTWITAEMLPVAAGLFLAWAHFLNFPRAERERLQKIRMERADIARFLEELRPLLGTPAASPAAGSSGQSSSGPGFPPAAAAVIAMLMMAASAVPAQAQARGEVCGIAADRTMSLDPVQREQGLALVEGTLREMVDSWGCRALVAGNFANEGAWAPRSSFPLPVRGKKNDCSRAEPVSHTDAPPFKPLVEYQKNKAVADCTKKEALLAQRADRQWTGIAARVMAILRKEQSGPESNTSILDVTQSYIDAGVTRLAVLTDGIENRADPLVPLRMKANAVVVMLLSPARADFGGQDATWRAATEWKRLNPRMIVVPSTELTTPGFWTRTTNTENVKPDSS